MLFLYVFNGRTAPLAAAAPSTPPPYPDIWFTSMPTMSRGLAVRSSSLYKSTRIYECTNIRIYEYEGEKGHGKPILI